MSADNADLPILDELATEFAALVDAELAPGRRSAPVRRSTVARPPARRRRDRSASRIARRAAVVLVLLCLIGGVALAARFDGGGESPPAETEPATIGQQAGWQLSAYRDRGRLCFSFASGGEPSGHCTAALHRGGISAASALFGERRYVVGLAGAAARSVEARADGATVQGGAHRVIDADAAADAGIPPGTRWFVLPLPATGSSRSAPAWIVARDAGGRRLGRPFLDCSLGVGNLACAHRIGSRAARLSD